MSRFVEWKRQTPDYREAVRLLRRVEEAAGEADRAFAEAVHQKRMETWAKHYKLKRTAGHVCFARLVGRRCRSCGYYNEYYASSESPPCRPPGCDHPNLWIHGGKPVAFTFEPYGLPWDKVRKLVTCCKEWGAEVRIDTCPAGHFPGRVLWVEITRADKPLWKLAEAAG